MKERAISTPVGEVVLGASSTGLMLCATGDSARELKAKLEKANDVSRAEFVLDAAVRALSLYFRGEFSSLLSIPLELSGTEFRRSVYRSLVSVRAGEIISYKELAEWIGKPGAIRAVGSACRENPLHLFVPCHRVVSVDGALSGFRGGVEIKKTLLSFEQEIQTVEERTEGAVGL
jgi:O-6-methylguanine DNA methyltransferase